MEIAIRNEQGEVEISDTLMQKLKLVLEKVLEEHNMPNSEVCVIFVDDDFIHDLNEKYRGKAQSTDVLSFNMQEHEEDNQKHFSETNETTGDIIISAETAARQCEEYGHNLEKEISYLTVHGLLHLLGYDHDTEERKKEMRSLEKEILRLFNLENRDD